jgi:DNA (cytosine-5)-methyltransferase 1
MRTRGQADRCLSPLSGWVRRRGLVRACVLNASHYGVPQARRRLIFIGFREDLGIEPSFPEPTTPVPFTLADALGSVAPDDSDHESFLAPGEVGNSRRR